LQDPPKFTQIGIFGLKKPSGNPGYDHNCRRLSAKKLAFFSKTYLCYGQNFAQLSLALFLVKTPIFCRFFRRKYF
jgi:hypothetical protein